VASLATVVDDFSGSLNTTRWPDNNGVTVTGGQAVLACNTNYSDLGTASSYTLDTTGVYAKVTPAAANGGSTGNCYLRMALLASGQPEGTFLGIVVDTIEGGIYFQKATSYWDNSGPRLDYSPTTHAWWKIALSGTNVIFQTSTNGTTWTTRYTTARPSYYNSTQFKLNFEAHRDSGTANTAIIDNVNTTSSVTVVTGALAASAGATQTLAGSGVTFAALSQAAGATLTAAGFARTTAAATLTAGATQTLAGLGKTTGGSSLGATGSFTAAGIGKTTGALPLAGTASLALSATTAAGPAELTVTAGATLTVGGFAKTTGAAALAATGTLAAAGTGKSTGPLALSAGAALAATGKATTTGALALAAAGDVDLTGSRIMAPKLGSSSMSALGSFSLAVTGSVTTFGQLVPAGEAALALSGAGASFGALHASATSGALVVPDTTQVFHGELVLVGEAAYHQWTNKTVVPIAFGYLTGEVDA